MTTLERPTIIYTLGTIWALLGGALIIGTALFQRGQAQPEDAGETQAVQAQPQEAGETAPDTGQQSQPPSPST